MDAFSPEVNVISITDPSCVTIASLPICARILSIELPAPVTDARLHSSRLSVAPAGSHSSMPLLWNTECAQAIHATMRTPHPRFIDGGSLIKGLAMATVVTDPSAMELFEIEPVCFDEALRDAV